MAVRPARRSLLYVFFGLVLMALGLYLGRILQRSAAPHYDALVLVASEGPLPAFQVTAFLGQPLNLDRLRGHWTLILLAPLDAALANREGALGFGNRVLNRLAVWPKLRADLQVLYLANGGPSSQETLKSLVLRTNPRMWAATVSPPLRRALGAGPGDPPLFYLLDPEIRLRALFTPEGDPVTIAADMERLIHAPAAP